MIVNGRYASWHSLKIDAQWAEDKFSSEDFASISFKDARNGEIVHGTSGDPAGDTEGDYVPEASMGMYIDAAMEFMAALAANAPTRGGKARIGLKKWDISLKWVVDDDGPVHRVRVAGCRIKERNFDASKSTEAGVITFPLLVTQGIEMNGILL